MFNRNARFNAKTMLFCLILLTAIVMALTSVGAETGVWQQCLGQTMVCESGSVCAEWDVDGSTVGSCCVPQTSLGTGELSVCEGTFVLY